EVGHVEAEVTDLGLVAHDEGAGPGADAVGGDHEIEVALGAAREGDGDPIVAVAETSDPVAEDVLDIVSGAVVEDTGEVTAEDLQPRGRATRPRGARGALAPRQVALVDEPDPLLSRRGGADVVLDPHAPRDRPRGAADVDVLPAAPERAGALDDDRPKAVALQ